MTENGGRRVLVTIYRFTGQHGPINVPHRKCVECDLSIALVNRTVEEIGLDRIDVEVKSWFLRFWEPLVKGGWHAPIVIVDGRGLQPGRGAGPRPAPLRFACCLRAPRGIPGS